MLQDSTSGHLLLYRVSYRAYLIIDSRRLA
jgi:hypothetical protein